jgi:hypothetical protein
MNGGLYRLPLKDCLHVRHRLLYLHMPVHMVGIPNKLTYMGKCTYRFVLHHRVEQTDWHHHLPYEAARLCIIAEGSQYWSSLILFQLVVFPVCRGYSDHLHLSIDLVIELPMVARYNLLQSRQTLQHKVFWQAAEDAGSNHGAVRRLPAGTCCQADRSRSLVRCS